jgi:hypothetical protein
LLALRQEYVQAIKSPQTVVANEDAQLPDLFESRRNAERALPGSIAIFEKIESITPYENHIIRSKSNFLLLRLLEGVHSTPGQGVCMR